MILKDESGSVKFALCALVLFVNHGMRDYLITSIPSIVIRRNSSATTRSVILLRQNFPYNLENFDFVDGITHNEHAVYHDVQTQFCSEEQVIMEGWTNAYVGLALSIIHWTWIIPLVASPFLIKRITAKRILIVSLASAGIVAIFSEMSAKDGPGNFVILRAIQGFFQGWCYPIVYYILHNMSSSAFVVPFFVIFLAPWIGSSSAVLLGGVQNPFTGAYVFGSLSILLSCLSFFVSFPEEHEIVVKPKNIWRETLKSLPVWACVSVKIGGVWALHTFMIGLSLNNTFRFCRSDLVWTVFAVILVGGVTTRIVAVAAMGLMRQHFLSALNRRRFVISSGSGITVVALIINSTIGTDIEWVLFGMCIAGVCLGVSFCLVGVRLNLHDLGPSFPIPFLSLGGLGASIGAGAASLLFPIFAKVLGDSSDDLSTDGPYLTAWLVPIAIMVASCVSHLFLLSVNPLSHQTVVVVEEKTTISSLNGGIQANNQEFDLKSFKSIKSAPSFKSARNSSFKSAASRSRTRTVSFKTADEEIDPDLQSIADSDSEECRSAIDDDNDDHDMKSIKSGATSFKSTGEEQIDNGVQRGVVLDVPQLDRTSAWLSTHHYVNGKTLNEVTAENSKEKKRVEKNILFAIQW